MSLGKILAATATGTTLMTLYSYALSEKKKKQFKEPVLLSEMVERLNLTQNDGAINRYKVDGWLIHYAVGAGFSSIYNVIWKKTSVKPTLTAGIVMGGISGLIGIAAWKTAFRIHPNPPTTDFKKYYGHLMIAHIIFGAASAMGYRIPKK